MKRFALSFAALLITAGASFAAEPAMWADSSAGKILVDPAGMTLYTFDKDTAGVSNCYDGCLAKWPILAVAADAKAEGDWSIVDRKDGTKVWALKGKPLYYFVDDKAVGDLKGDGLNNVWHIIKAE